MQSSFTGRRDALRVGLVVGAGLTAGFPASAASIVNGVVVGKNGWLFLVYDDPRQGRTPRSQQVTKLIADAIGLIRARGIECAILLTPSNARIYADHLPDDWAFTPEGQRRYAQGLEALRTGGAFVPDLAQIMLAHRQANPAAPLFFRNDTHWTPSATELVAKEFAGAIAQRLALPASRGRENRLGPPVQVPGTENDLLNLLPVADRAKYQVEPFFIRRPLAEGSRNALVEDDSADVAIVGNSYAQPKLNLAPAISAEMGRPVSLTWDNHLKGPYKILLTYLQGAGFKRQRPKLIVWNVLEQDLALPPSDARAFMSNAMTADEFLSAIRQAVA